MIWQLYKVYKKRARRLAINTANGCAQQLCKGAEKGKIYEVMFFMQSSSLCRSHLGIKKVCTKPNCAVGYLMRILDCLNSATDTLDLCMYFFTFPDLANAIINAKKRNVVVRLILDESMAKNDISQIMNFYKEGIRPISKRLDTLMHHKFVIIDNKIVITGSVNWTKSAFFGNFENILLTNDPAIVQPFVKEFENLWTLLSAVTVETNLSNSNIE
ncbi:PREDICTED: mitochondrial cardiolipin hydrolase isoform X2 [Vollenhovia emeryi]|nr:PREDICTED: mitochondrial cardiolipin hydrolase isoform X2 [Vollenhovia emeryi]XP_011878312.1 PREDICTED: mitochondrial cardiolipin hydrolase isoform X2 [Vollenhovia emeryi]